MKTNAAVALARAVNREGLTFIEWWRATRIGPRQYALTERLARHAWAQGVDPTEYANG